MIAADQRQTIDTQQRRQFQRVSIDLHGRFMRQDRTEHECRIVEMSPGNAIIDAEPGTIEGTEIIAYIDHVGRIVGRVTRITPSGFAIDFELKEQKRERVAARLTWLANKHELNLPEDRRHERVAPRKANNTLALSDGREYSCRMLDLSLSGAAVEIAVRPAIGTLVTLGNLRGRVVRHFNEGIAIEFAHVQSSETLSGYM